MISAHVYRAFLIGTPDRELTVKGGQITLDDSRAPHVQADLTIGWPGEWEVVPDTPPVYGGLVWRPDDELLEALDPKLSPRVRVEVSASLPNGIFGRYFYLGVRERVPEQGTGEVRLKLASDEALLTDYAPLADDMTPFNLAMQWDSLRRVVQHVLNRCVTDQAPDLVPGPDASIRPFWEATNLLRNPAVVTNLNGWAAGGGCNITFVSEGSSGAVNVATTGATGAVFAVDTTKYNLTATPGETYHLELSQRAVSPSAGGNGRAVLRFLDANNATISEREGEYENMSYSYNTVTVSAIAPPGAVKIAPFWRFEGGAGRTYRLDQGILHTSRFPVPVFTGGNAAGAGYTYRFEGPSNDSSSTRVPDIERDPEALVWRAGQSGIDFLHPLVQAAGLRLVCDEERRWSLRSATYVEPGSTTIRYGANMIEGSDSIDRDSGLWFDAQVTVYKWTDRDGIQQERIDAYALNTPPTRVNRVELEAPYFGPGRSKYAVERAQGRGREVSASAVARWTEYPEQSITVMLNGAPTQVGRISAVTFDLGPGNGRDRVTVTTRTADAPESSWVLIPLYETWHGQPAGESWLDEEI